MSKSIGNVIDPLVVCNKYGADILRLWTANTDYEEDVRISDNILKQTAEIYRRIRNSLFRFCLANTADFNYEKDVNLNFDEVDDFVLWQLEQNIIKINFYYEKYQFKNVIKTINNHVIELSGWYFDLIKDTLYCESKDDPKRRRIQTVLFTLLKTYLILLTPIMPHTCEEVYKFINLTSKHESICLEPWINQIPNKPKNKVEQSKWEYFKQIKDIVYAELEIIRNKKEINKNNQAYVKLSFNNTFNFTADVLAHYLNVAKVEFINQSSEKILVEVTDAKLPKCERCWNHFDSQQMYDQHICRRCHNVISPK
jgi:isoleucyl-tRNA synthetase